MSKYPSSLPVRANAEHLRKQAKDRVHQARDEGLNLRLQQVQHTLAKDYGFASWNRLISHVQSSTAANNSISNIEQVVQALRSGKLVILFDESRENEGDFVLAAEKVTAESINFLTRYGRGTLCLAMTPEYIDRLGLQRMRPRTNGSDPAFCISFDAAEGVTTGVSASDRATTILTAVADHATPTSIRTPGHVFPLRAEPGGLTVRKGHTEGSVELMRRAGMKPCAVIIEILNEDGTMARLGDLEIIAAQYSIPIIKMSELL